MMVYAIGVAVVAGFVGLLLLVAVEVLRFRPEQPPRDKHEATYEWLPVRREELGLTFWRCRWMCCCSSYGYTFTEESARERFEAHRAARLEKAGVS